MKYEEFLDKAREIGICDEFNDKLDYHTGNKKLFNLFCDVKGMDYMFDAIAKGWGVSDDELLSRFKCLINGQKKEEYNGGYDSMLYCNYKGLILADTTLLGLINCERLTVEIPANNICEIYLTGKCNIRIVGEGRCICVCYGKEDNIKIQNYCSNYKRINKEKADSYE